MDCVKMILTLTLLVLLKESKGTPRWTNRAYYPSWMWQHVKRSETVQGIRDDSYQGNHNYSQCFKDLVIELFHRGEHIKPLVVDGNGILFKEEETTSNPITIVISGIDHGTLVSIAGLGPLFSTFQLSKQVVMIQGKQCAKAIVTPNELSLLGYDSTKQIKITVPNGTPYEQIDMGQTLL